MKQSDPFYRSARWRKAREARLEMDHYMCTECMKLYEAGLLRRPRRAEVVHHIKTYQEHPELALDLENLESLCSWHHAQEHPEKGMTPEKRRLLRDKTMRVIKV